MGKSPRLSTFQRSIIVPEVTGCVGFVYLDLEGRRAAQETLQRLVKRKMSRKLEGMSRSPVRGLKGTN